MKRENLSKILWALSEEENFESIVNEIEGRETFIPIGGHKIDEKVIKVLEKDKNFNSDLIEKLPKVPRRKTIINKEIFTIEITKDSSKILSERERIMKSLRDIGYNVKIIE